jgi:methyl-accepting chemotaxis protein
MLERTDAASGLTLQTVQTMGEVEQQMRGITRSLQDVDGIARALGILGLNASIEAARAGEHGRTFSVVASETTKLADAAAQISKSIQKIVAHLCKSVDDTSRTLCTVSTALSNDAKTSRREVDQAVAVMTATEKDLRRSVEQSARSSESLADDIARAVVAMQFQDSMSQQVTHVADALGEVEAGLSRLLPPGAARQPAESQPTRRDLAGNLTSRYTMQSERDTHAAQFGIPVGGASAQDDNVEFF